MHEYNDAAFVDKCSICFDNKFDFILRQCRDQFCKSCFSKYVDQIININWGVSSFKIHCPVCQFALIEQDWLYLINEDIRRRYREAIVPFKPLVRYCACEKNSELCLTNTKGSFRNECGSDINSCFKQIDTAFDELISTTRITQDPTVDVRVLDSQYDKLRETVCANINSELAVADFFNQTVQLFNQFFDDVANSGISSEKENYHTAAALNKLVSSLLMLFNSPESWIEAQYNFLAKFHVICCKECVRTACFYCGTTPYHYKQTCLDALRSISQDGEDKLNACWKLTHLKPCPKCFVMTEKNGGCEHIQCIVCGYGWNWFHSPRLNKFFSPKREIHPIHYHLPLNARSKAVANNAAVTVVSEPGVPDVFEIEKRIRNL